MNNKKRLILVLLALIIVIGVTAGVTWAFLSYTKEGVKENRITTGKITFHYNEDSNQGISLDDALPMSDANGQSQNKYFDFTITSDNGTEVNIPYMITARKVSNQASEIDNQYVKVRLTKVTTEDNIDSENQVLLDTYDTLSTVVKNNHNEEVLWTDSVLAGNTNYEQKYRLRLWLSDQLDFSPLKDGNGNYIEESGEYVYPNNDKEFSIKVNVYSGSQTTQASQQQSLVNSINVANIEASEIDNPNYDYQVSVPSDTTSTTIEVETADEYANVKIERIDDPTGNNTGYNYEKTRVERMAINKTVSLEPGDNYFRVTIIPTVGSQTQYILKVKVENAPGFYAEDGTIITWDELVNTYGLNATNVSNGATVLSTINKSGKLVIPGSVKKVANSAFYWSTLLTSVELLDGVEELDSAAFYRCTALSEIILPNTLKKIGVEPGTGVISYTNITELVIPDSVEVLGQCAVCDNKKLTSLTLGKNLKEIGPSAISGNTELENVVIPASVTLIKTGAFMYDYKLTTVTFTDDNNWSVDVSNPTTNAINFRRDSSAYPAISKTVNTD